MLQHIPTKTVVRVDGRKRKHNQETALREMKKRLQHLQTDSFNTATNQARQKQIGSGMRGDKRRTIRFQDSSVVDHVLGRSMRLKEYLRGDLKTFRN